MKQRRRRTGIITDERLISHKDQFNLEVGARLNSLLIELECNQEELLNRCVYWKSCPKVKKEDVLRVHTLEHYQTIQFLKECKTSKDWKFWSKSFKSIEVNSDSLNAIERSAGGIIKLCEKIYTGRIDNGFALVRPPSHHACTEPSGFCFYAGVSMAIAKYKCLKPGAKMAIIDLDYHFGESALLFQEDPKVLTVSFHHYGNGKVFPGYKEGRPDFIGKGKGLGYHVNLAWQEAGYGDFEYLVTMLAIVYPILMEFSPDFMIVCAGFDACQNDPIGQCRVSSDGFAVLIHILCIVMNHKNIMLTLEGGYHIPTLKEAVMKCLNVLLNNTTSSIQSVLKQNKGKGKLSKALLESLSQTIMKLSPYWHSLSEF